MTEQTIRMVRKQEENPHIDRESFCGWLAGEMKPDREDEFLGHIAGCTFCAGRFAEWMEVPQELCVERMELPQELCARRIELPHEPPRYLKEEILQRTHQMDVQVSVHVKEKSRQMQLILYSLKVGLAVMTSIFLLMLTSNVMDMDSGSVRSWRIERMQQRQENIPSITDALNQKSGEVSSFLNEMSNGLFGIGADSKK